MSKQKYQLIVSEPWDYISSNGTNIIKGEIIRMISSQFLLFKSDELLTFGTISGFLLILKPRYYGESFMVESKVSLTVGGALLLNNVSENSMPQELENNSKYVLIGGFSVVE